MSQTPFPSLPSLPFPHSPPLTPPSLPPSPPSPPLPPSLPPSLPSLPLLQESSGRVLRSNTISVADKELVAGPWNQMSLESQASLLYAVPLPMGGVLAVGYETVAYYNLDVQLAIDPPMIKVCMPTCTCTCVGVESIWILAALLLSYACIHAHAQYGSQLRVAIHVSKNFV